MTEVESKRRSLLLGLGGAGLVQALSNGWVKPVVDVVVLPSHAATTPGQAPDLQCTFDRGEEGSSPRVNGINFVIDSVIRLMDDELLDGDPLTARHQVAAAGYDETFVSSVNQVGDNKFVGAIPFSIPLPVGVAPGQSLEITVTATGGTLVGRSCTGSLAIA